MLRLSQSSSFCFHSSGYPRPDILKHILKISLPKILFFLETHKYKLDAPVLYIESQLFVNTTD